MSLEHYLEKQPGAKPKRGGLKGSMSKTAANPMFAHDSDDSDEEFEFSSPVVQNKRTKSLQSSIVYDDDEDEYEQDSRKGSLSRLPEGFQNLMPPVQPQNRTKKKKWRAFGGGSSSKVQKEEKFELESIKTHDDSDYDDFDDDMEEYVEVRQGTGFKNRLRNYLMNIGNGGYMNGIYGGGAFSFLITLILAIPPVASSLAGLSYFWVGQWLAIPLILYIIMSVPVALGFLFAWGLRTLGPLNGYPFSVGAISLFPIIKGWTLCVRLVVYDATFGNPPGFPFKNFLECARVDIEGSISFRDILNLLTFTKVPSPMKMVPDFKRFMFIDFDHVEVSDCMCNFQMYRGKFNINEFTRILATGEAEAVLKGNEFPNQLSVQIIRGADLKPHRLKTTIDPYVVVRVRRNVKETKTQTKTVNPMFNETLYFTLEDPSVVMEIAVYDRNAPDGSQAALIGHWAMTTKYLITDPTYCWSIADDDFSVYRPDPKRRKNNPLGFEGWIPLAAKNWKQMGQKGRLHIRLLWQKVPEDELVDTWKPIRRYTALEQLQQQSAEDQLRFGSWERFRNWLQHEPFNYDVRRFTVRSVKFYVQDLFRGHKGKVEVLVKNKRRESTHSIDSLESDGPDEVLVQDNVNANCVKIPFMEMTKQFRPKYGDEGVTSYEIFLGFFIGLISQFRKRGKLGGALGQILSGGVFNMSKSISHFFKGDFEKTAIPSMAEGLSNIAKLAKNTKQVVNQNFTKNRIDLKEFNRTVQGTDSDFLLEDIELAGYLDRYAMKAKSNVTNETMLLSTRKGGNFKTRWFFVKGDTIFFRSKEELKEDYLYNLTYRLHMADIQSAIFSRESQEIVLNVQIDGYFVRLRMPRKAKKIPKTKIKSLDSWVQLLHDHGVVCAETD